MKCAKLTQGRRGDAPRQRADVGNVEHKHVVSLVKGMRSHVHVASFLKPFRSYASFTKIYAFGIIGGHSPCSTTQASTTSPQTDVAYSGTCVRCHGDPVYLKWEVHAGQRYSYVARYGCRPVRSFMAGGPPHLIFCGASVWSTCYRRADQHCCFTLYQLIYNCRLHCCTHSEPFA